MQSTFGQQSLGHESQPEAETEPFGVEVVVVLGSTVLLTVLGVLGLTVAPEFVADGVDPRVALDAALPPTGSPATSSSSTSVPSSSANPLGSTRPIGVRFLVVLERSTRLDSPLRSGERVFHSSMPVKA